MVERPRIALDTKTLMSAMCFPNSFGRRAADWASAHGQLIVSTATAAELFGVAGRDKFDRFVSPEHRNRFIEEYLAEAEWIEIVERIEVCRDPDDDRFLELAINGGAHYLITRDNDLLVLDPFRDVRILDAEAFVAMVYPGVL